VVVVVVVVLAGWLAVGGWHTRLDVRERGTERCRRDLCLSFDIALVHPFSDEEQ
jgi:hypothetical protein